MGRYSNDFSRVKRDSWVFKFTAKELITPLTKKLRELQKEEHAKRKELADIMLNPLESVNSDKLEILRARVQHLGSEGEKCMAWLYGLSRQPDDLFELHYSDITYLDMMPELTLESTS